MTNDAKMTWHPIGTAPRDGSWFVSANFNAAEPEYDLHQYAPYNWETFEPVPGEDGLFRKTVTPVSEFSGSNFHRATHWTALPDALEPHP